MIYKDISIPPTFNRIAEVSDNYIVFVKADVMNNKKDYEAYIQYIVPSTFVIYVPNYRITKYDTVETEYNYYNNNGIFVLDSSSEVLTLHTTTSDDFSSENIYRADLINIFFGQILSCIVVLWVFKQLSRLFYRGGLW